jgi:hypothetical protein
MNKKPCVLRRIFGGKVRIEVSLCGKRSFDVLYGFFCDGKSHMRIKIDDVVKNGMSFLCDAKKDQAVMSFAKGAVWSDVERRAEVVMFQKYQHSQRVLCRSKKNIDQAIFSVVKKKPSTV